MSQRVALGFALVLGVVAVLAAVSLAAYRRIDRSSERLSLESLPATLAILEIQQALKENFGLSQTLHTARDPAAIEAQVKANIARIDGLLADYPRFLHDDAERREFANFGEVRAAWVKSFKELMRLQRAGQTREAAEWTGQQVLPAYQAVNEALSAITRTNLASLETVNRGVRADVRFGSLSLVAGLAGAALLAALVGFFICRTIARLLRHAADELIGGAREVTAAAGQVAAAAQSLAEGSSRQAAALEQTSASTEELTGTTRQNDERAAGARKVADEARIAADQGARAAERLGTAMGELQVSNREVAAIVKTIDEIAFQTNILALNAAVEAARAGEHGAGFAVVAEEVRALAQRSAGAARETADKIQSAQARSEEGIRISGEVVASLGALGERVRGLDTFVAEISQASHEQSGGVTLINNAIAELDQNTQAGAAAAEEAASAAQELDAQARHLNGMVGDLMLLAGGRRSRDTRGVAGDRRSGGRRRED